jgi:amidase
MARSAGDLRLLLDVIAGPSPYMSRAWKLNLPECRHQQLSDFRVLLWVDDPFCEIDLEMRASFCQLKDQLVSLGVQVVEGAPLNQGLHTYFPGYMNLLGSAMGGSSKKRERRMMGLIAPLANKLKDHLDIANTFEQFLKGVSQSHVEWASESERRYRLQRRFGKVFDEFDVILMPVAMTNAFKHQQTPDIPLRKLWVNGKKRVYADMFKWIAPATLMGLPATSAPIGMAGSMPVNVQIVGAPFEDKTTIQFAKLMAEEIGGFTAPPDFL